MNHSSHYIPPILLAHSFMISVVKPKQKQSKVVTGIYNEDERKSGNLIHCSVVYQRRTKAKTWTFVFITLFVHG